MRFIAGLSLASAVLSSGVLCTLAVSLPNVLNVHNNDGSMAYEDWGRHGQPPVQAGIPNNPPGPKLPTPRPLVVWHGLGDTYASAGMLEFMQLIKEIHKDIFIHSVYLDVDPVADQRAGWFGYVNEQIHFAANQLANITELKDGFDAIGFSQAGQFLRAYAQRYPHASPYPRVHNLVTFGSQHMGVCDLPGCKPTDFLCRAAHTAARAGVYSVWAQSNLVQAQYFRDHARYPTYLEVNTFLVDLNNESPDVKNQTYVDNLNALDALVLVIFEKDKTVVPKESSWFGSWSITDPEEDDEPEMLTMKQQPLYKEDWIGLKSLDEAGKVFLESCPGEHMQLPTECWEWIIRKWVGQKQI